MNVSQLLVVEVVVADHALFTAGEICKMRELAQDGGDVVSTCISLQHYTTSTQVFV